MEQIPDLVERPIPVVFLFQKIKEFVPFTGRLFFQVEGDGERPCFLQKITTDLGLEEIVTVGGQLSGGADLATERGVPLNVRRSRTGENGRQCGKESQFLAAFLHHRFFDCLGRDERLSRMANIGLLSGAHDKEPVRQLLQHPEPDIWRHLQFTDDHLRQGRKKRRGGEVDLAQGETLPLFRLVSVGQIVQSVDAQIEKGCRRRQRIRVFFRSDNSGMDEDRNVDERKERFVATGRFKTIEKFSDQLFLDFRNGLFLQE